MTKKISEDQFWQLVGLCTAGRESWKKFKSFEDSYNEITGGKDDTGRFIDLTWEDADIINELKKMLPYDEVEVEWKDD